MRRGLAALLLALALGAGAGPVAAQQADPVTPVAPSTPAAPSAPPRSPVLTIDADRLYAESLYGERVAADLLAQTEALAAENREIEAQLTQEERSLTLRRPTMPAEEFRTAAEAFDERVQEIRQQQDAKERALSQTQSQGRDAFLSAATPVLGRLMIDRGAAVILDRRSVFLGIGVFDVTDEAIAAVDAAIGDGTEPPVEPPTAPAPEPEADPAPVAPAPEPAPPPAGD